MLFVSKVNTRYVRSCCLRVPGDGKVVEDAGTVRDLSGYANPMGSNGQWAMSEKKKTVSRKQ